MATRTDIDGAVERILHQAHPARCKRFWELRDMRMRVKPGTHYEDEVVARYNAHMKTCPECIAWWEWVWARSEEIVEVDL